MKCNGACCPLLSTSSCNQDIAQLPHFGCISFSHLKPSATTQTGIRNKVLSRPLCLHCRVEKGWEEVTVPAVKTSALGPNEALVSISELPRWCQLTFPGYK